MSQHMVTLRSRLCTIGSTSTITPMNWNMHRRKEKGRVCLTYVRAKTITSAIVGVLRTPIPKLVCLAQR
eukprot:1388359-Pyramimonas_sp.AAC.1